MQYKISAKMQKWLAPFPLHSHTNTFHWLCKPYLPIPHMLKVTYSTLGLLYDTEVYLSFAVSELVLKNQGNLIFIFFHVMTMSHVLPLPTTFHVVRPSLP